MRSSFGYLLYLIWPASSCCISISLVWRKCQDPSKVMFQQLLRSNSDWVSPVDTWARPPTKSTAINMKYSTLTPTLPSAPTLAGQWINITKINMTSWFWLCYLGERGRRYSRKRGTLSGPSLRLIPPLSVRSRSYAGRGPPRPMLYRTGPSRNSRCGGSMEENKWILVTQWPVNTCHILPLLAKYYPTKQQTFMNALTKAHYYYLLLLLMYVWEKFFPSNYASLSWVFMPEENRKAYFTKGKTQGDLKHTILQY